MTNRVVVILTHYIYKIDDRFKLLMAIIKFIKFKLTEIFFSFTYKNYIGGPKLDNTH